MPSKTLIVAAVSSAVIQLLLICSATAAVSAKDHDHKTSFYSNSNAFNTAIPATKTTFPRSYTPCTAVCSIVALLSLPFWHHTLVHNLADMYIQLHQENYHHVSSCASQNDLYDLVLKDFMESVSLCEKVLKCNVDVGAFEGNVGAGDGFGGDGGVGGYGDAFGGEFGVDVEQNFTTLHPYSLDPSLHPTDEQFEQEYLSPLTLRQRNKRSAPGTDVDRVKETERRRILAKLNGYMPFDASLVNGEGYVGVVPLDQYRILGVQTACFLAGIVILLAACR
ncbi:hypothetical protein BJ741DRAFT_678742 [Chytriomyces cf. hyalinus JEL632]|nr:hypothetical protein BJ741DRAFT_678742 [Chytriomyces cf. hyalinus JEL632]